MAFYQSHFTIIRRELAVPGISKIFLSGFIGAMVCAILGFFMFFLLALLDKTKVSEAFGYSLLVAFGCAFIGAVIGLIIGIGNLKPIGGVIVGVLATLCTVVAYVFAFGRPGQTAHFLGESRIILIVLSLPTMLTGIFTALLKNLIYKS
jgi:hypothetical protein